MVKNITHDKKNYTVKSVEAKLYNTDYMGWTANLNQKKL